MMEGDLDHVHCSGRFDEDTRIRLPCSFKSSRESDKVPRLHPWYTTEPTEEEKQAMDEELETARAAVDGGGADSGEGAALLEAASKMDWKLVNKQGIQQATLELIELVEGKVDLPQGKELKRLLGPILVENKDQTPKEIVQKVIDKYGFAEAKEAKAAKREAALESVCANPKNAPLLAAFQELAQLYFKGKYYVSFYGLVCV